MADEEDAAEADGGEALQARSSRMTQIEEIANKACERLMAQVRRGFTMQGNEDCAWTRADAGKIAYNHVGDLLAEAAHGQGVGLEAMTGRLQETMDLVNRKLDRIEWKPTERVSAIVTITSPAKMLQAAQAMERVIELELKGAGESKKRLLKTFAIKARAYEDELTELVSEDQTQLRALVDQGASLQSMHKLLKTRVQAAEDTNAREGATRQQKVTAKAEMDKAAKAVVDAGKALEKAQAKRAGSVTQQLTGVTRLGSASYNELATELSIIAAIASAPDVAKKVKFGDITGTAEEDSVSATILRTSDLKDIIKERTGDLFGNVLGIELRGHWTRASTQQDQLLFLLAASRLCAEFMTFPNSKVLIFTNMSARIKVQRPVGVTTPLGLMQSLWDGFDKQDLDTVFTSLHEQIANAEDTSIQERFAHMADCVSLQQRIKAKAPLLQWAIPPEDSIATEAYRLLTVRMGDEQPGKAKLHVYNPLAGTHLTLASANELCANVDKALHMDAKRKAADDGGSPASKRAANFNLLDSPGGPKNGSSMSSNASSPAEAGTFMNLQTGPGAPNMASGTWNAARFAMNGQPQAVTQAATTAQAQPAAQPASQYVTDGGQSSNGGAPNGWQRSSPGSWKGGRGGYRGGKGLGKGKGKGGTPTCYNCNQVGHYTGDCKLPRTAKPFHTCYTCNTQGHWAADCPQQAAAQFLVGQQQPAQAQAAIDGAQQSPLRRPTICYKCGGVGHRQAECNANW